MENTVKHFKIYLNADMYFVSLSYKDITPTKLGFFKTDFFIEKPLIYLQHGTLGIKAIEYKGYGYNNNMFRFLYYNKNIKPTLMDYNKFKDYQLYYGIYPPRYIELVKQPQGIPCTAAQRQEYTLVYDMERVPWRQLYDTDAYASD